MNQPARDARIVAIWSAHVIMSSDVGSVATELRMQFSGDGIMRDLSSRTIGDIAGGIIDTGTSSAHVCLGIVDTSIAARVVLRFAVLRQQCATD